MVVTGTRGDVGRHGIDVALDVGAQLQPDGLGRREVLFDGGRAYVTWDMGLGGAWCLMMMMFGVAGRMKERSNDWAGGGRTEVACRSRWFVCLLGWLGWCCGQAEVQVVKGCCLSTAMHGIIASAGRSRPNDVVSTTYLPTSLDNPYVVFATALHSACRIGRERAFLLLVAVLA